jgi:hypothetical protein
VTTPHWEGATDAILHFHLPLRRGDRIRSVTAYIEETFTATITLTLLKGPRDRRSAVTRLGTATSPGGGVRQVLTLPDLAELVAGDASYFAVFKVRPGTSNVVRVLGLEVGCSSSCWVTAPGQTGGKSGTCTSWRLADRPGSVISG